MSIDLASGAERADNREVPSDPRCEMCDLPVGQCVHTVKKPAKPRTAGKKGKRETRPAVQRSVRTGTVIKRKKAPASELCVECGKRHRYSRYNICLTCGLALNRLTLCRKCGRYFKPSDRSEKRTCATCVRGRRAAEVWITATAGSPGLGKRA